MAVNKRLVIFLLIVIGLSILSIVYPYLKPTGQVTQVNYEREQAILARVIDGDTIELESGDKVRLLGINTPEKNMPYSNESKMFLQQFMNKTLELERDREDLDKYSRKLRYIFFEDRFLNLEIVERGLANSYMTSDLKYERNFINAEAQARLLGVGIWTKSSDYCSNCIELKKLNPINETFILINKCDFNCNLSGWFVKDAGRNALYLSIIFSNSEKLFQSKKNTWNNDGDEFFLFDNSGKLVFYYKY